MTASFNNAGSVQPSIESADIEWRDGQPVSKAFGDVYFSRDNGLEETRYVFLANNRLAERFADLSPGDTFVVAETGFGTGLNFLATWQAWQTSAPPGTYLHFVSAERFPLTPQDLQRALLLWPDLRALSDALLASYPPLVCGPHRLIFHNGQVRLTLYFGDALEAWRSLRFQADAWFLDGFAPALNPDLWINDLIHQVAAHSRRGTTLATFTAVGAVRRGLQAAGFDISKVPGFGRKRDMLAGTYSEGEEYADHTKPPSEPVATERTVTIIGAGIAAALTARNLAERGYAVQIISAGSGPADGASGNPQAALYVKLGVDYGPESKLALHALLHAQRTYTRYDTIGRQTDDGFWHPTGLLQLATTDHEVSRQSRFMERNQYPDSILRAVTYAEASVIGGVPVNHGGLWFPRSGWLEPPKVCSALLDHPLITCRFQSRVDHVLPQGHRWQVRLADGDILDTSKLVITGGPAVQSLLPGNRHYRFKAIRGQVSQLPEQSLTPIQTVICGKSYLNPPHNGWAVTGATFDLNESNPDVSLGSHQENLDKLTEWMPAIWEDGVPQPSTLRGRVSFRCTTHDYQPVVGPVTDDDWPAGLYVLTGLGSKGFAFAPLIAEWLVDNITGQPECVERNLAERLSLRRCEVIGDQNT